MAEPIEPTPSPAAAQVIQVAPDMVTIDDRRYQLKVNHKLAFDRERFAARYTEILDKYDYIVGDWGYDQLRLRGFYQNDNRRANKDQLIRTLEDYLYEYCNFGCAYFVLARLDAPAPKRRPARSGSRRGGKRRSDAKPYQEKISPTAAVTGKHAETVAPTKPRKRHFTIRTRETNEK
ncbi:YutD family protein [Lacticaseibacillus daqingensis]|uniref:YutD family protein n=1 Tax=Lacticaseibacillus daqingensis TaxID=2486014 RepID=UPI000F7B5EB1|nr:YutD family protein [Lacticaseibacillus daqingensis]